MVNPVVPENKRVCPTLRLAGRPRSGRPTGPAEGFCPKCGSQFSFTPKLQAGDLVANQYEVAGCLAHGGLGWIYLAKDKNVSDRWVVLKGLLNTGDADALAVAIIEKQFLAQVEHPLIVEIYNFVSHDGAGYIVMEYVGGVSLKDILKQRMREAGGSYNPLPVDQSLAYILEVLPAFQYLHDLGLVYCDFKPDNLIQIGDAVKLIDLGGVRRLDDEESAIYGTVGYQAPEVPQVGTSVASDIYTIGRTLLVLMAEFRGYQTTYVEKLPPVEDVPGLRRARLALPAGGQDVRPGPGGPVRLGRRAAGPAARVCCARWWPRSRPAPHSPRLRRCCSRHRRWSATRWPGTSCPPCGSTPPTASSPGCPTSPPTTPRSGWPSSSTRRPSPPRSSWPGPGPRCRPAGTRPCTRWSTRCSPSTRGSGERSG